MNKWAIFFIFVGGIVLATTIGYTFYNAGYDNGVKSQNQTTITNTIICISDGSYYFCRDNKQTDNLLYTYFINGTFAGVADLNGQTS